MMRIAVPVIESKGRESRLSAHFGRAPYFAVYSTDENKLDFVRNRGGHFGGAGTPAERMAKLEPDVVFALGMGPKAIRLFSSRGIRVRTGRFKDVGQVVDNLGELERLDKGCEEHRH